MLEKKKIRIVSGLGYVLSHLVFNYYSRKNDSIFDTMTFQIMLITSFALSIYAAFFITKEKFEFRIRNAFLVSFFFMVENVLHLKFQCKISSIYSTVFSQCKLILLFIITTLCLKKKVKKTEIIGLSLVIISIILTSTVKSKRNNSKDLFNCFVVVVGSLIGAVAISIFEIVLKPEIFNTFNYLFASQLITFILCLFMCLIDKSNFITCFKSFPFFILSMGNVMLSLSSVFLSCSTELIPRFLFTTASKCFSDLTVTKLLGDPFNIYALLYYFLGLFGVLIYKFNSLKEYFVGKKNIP